MSRKGSTSATWPTTRRWNRSTTCNVRKALNMAINKQAIIDAVFQGAGQGGEEPDPADDLVL